MQVLLLAAENGALPRGKVGGIGDVMRDLPVALAERGIVPTVMTPAYGMFAALDGAREFATIPVEFAGAAHSVRIVEVPGPDPRVRHLVLDHPRFTPCGTGRIYCDDPPETPFATDAAKFAFFCTATAAFVAASDSPPDVVHLHDWHSALYLALRAFDPRFEALRRIRTVYTIHNLALQGIRPLRHHPSSAETWFPRLQLPAETVADPRYADCINPMALAIRLADSVNTVSPTYATEILQADDPARGFYGGEGLERDLQAAHEQSRLSGILNGCEYPQNNERRPTWKALRDAIEDTLAAWISSDTHVHSAHYLASMQLANRIRRKPPTLLVSIGRITSQKVGLFLETLGNGDTALDRILAALEPDELFIMLGSGDGGLERRLARFMTRHANFLFLKGYTDGLPDLLYASGDLFLMPSSFEPCGISQMLAMRAGQPCVVHGVGGLRDTVEDLRTGFVFDGDSPRAQAANFVAAVAAALSMKSSSETRWKAMRRAAAAERFSWARAAEAYEERLYDAARA